MAPDRARKILSLEEYSTERCVELMEGKAGQDGDMLRIFICISLVKHHFALLF